MAVRKDGRESRSDFRNNFGGRDIFAFTDRPYRKHGYMSTEKFASLWDEGGTLNEDPPNAVLTWVSGEDMKESEIIIRGAEWHSDGRVTYSYTLETGDVLDGSMKCISLFVDSTHTCPCSVVRRNF